MHRVPLWGTLALSLALLMGCAGAATPPVVSPTGPGGTAAPAVPATATPPDVATNRPPSNPPSTDAPPIPATATAIPASPPTVAPTVPPAVATLTDPEALIVYSLIAHDLVGLSVATATLKKAPPFIGINPRAGKGPLLDTDSATATIPQDLIDNMADLGTTVTFSSFMDAVGALENGGQVRDNGIYLTFGQLEPQGSPDRVAAYASIYRANTDATGYRYLVERVADGPWIIKDRQQVWDH